MGLIFVAVCLHLSVIVRHPEWHGPAVGSVGVVASMIFLAILILIPGQPRRLLGLEIALLGGLP